MECNSHKILEPVCFSKWDIQNRSPQRNYVPTKSEPTTNCILGWETRDQYCTGFYESIGNGHVDMERMSFWDDALFALDWKINIRNDRCGCFVSHREGGKLRLCNPKIGHPKAVHNRRARDFEETVTFHC
jgi:hypothetical protein